MTIHEEIEELREEIQDLIEREGNQRPHGESNLHGASISQGRRA